MEVAISLPGNCQEKTVSGALLISEWYNEYWVCMIIMCSVGVKSSRGVPGECHKSDSFFC